MKKNFKTLLVVLVLAGSEWVAYRFPVNNPAAADSVRTAIYQQKDSLKLISKGALK